jgi:hypothetical protein
MANMCSKLADGGAPVTGPDSMLRGAVEACAREDMRRLSGDELGERALELRRAIDRLEVEFARSLLAFQRRHGGPSPSPRAKPSAGGTVNRPLILA